MNLTGPVRLNQRRTVLAKYVHSIPVGEFDTPEISVILSGRSQTDVIVLCKIKVSGCPHCGENREAGVNPARSRHCDENCRQTPFVRLERQMPKPGDLPMSLCSLLNTSRKGVQVARIPGPLSSPADSLFPARETEIGGICCY